MSKPQPPPPEKEASPGPELDYDAEVEAAERYEADEAIAEEARDIMGSMDVESEDESDVQTKNVKFY